VAAATFSLGYTHCPPAVKQWNKHGLMPTSVFCSPPKPGHKQDWRVRGRYCSTGICLPPSPSPSQALPLPLPIRAVPLPLPPPPSPSSLLPSPSARSLSPLPPCLPAFAMFCTFPTTAIPLPGNISCPPPLPHLSCYLTNAVELPCDRCLQCLLHVAARLKGEGALLERSNGRLDTQ